MTSFILYMDIDEGLAEADATGSKAQPLLCKRSSGHSWDFLDTEISATAAARETDTYFTATYALGQKWVLLYTDSSACPPKQ
jgi:hypothetical protein